MSMHQVQYCINNITSLLQKYSTKSQKGSEYDQEMPQSLLELRCINKYLKSQKFKFNFNTSYALKHTWEYAVHNVLHKQVWLVDIR